MSMFIELLKKLCILGLVLLQYGIAIINLNRFGLFQKFIELEFYETQPSKEEPLRMNDPYEPDLFV